MKTIYYKVSIEPGIKRTLSNFEQEVKKILTDKRSFPINFIQNQENYNFEVELVKASSVRKHCGFKGLSCADTGLNKVFINNYRWLKGSAKSKLDLPKYRRYVIQHEFFHLLGYGHSEPIKGELVAISVQQTKGIGEAKSNCFPLQWEKDFVNNRWNK
jgi:hypothetical protein